MFLPGTVRCRCMGFAHFRTSAHSAESHFGVSASPPHANSFVRRAREEHPTPSSLCCWHGMKEVSPRSSPFVLALFTLVAPWRNLRGLVWRQRRWALSRKLVTMASSHKVAKRPVPKRALEVVRAFGGYTVVVSPSLRVAYMSPDATSLPIVTKSVLTHPKLAELAGEAWRDGKAVVRHERFDDLGPIEQAEVAATKLAGRCVLVTIADVTAAMRIEQVRHDLISNIGHELRTPIAAISVIAETLDVAADDAKAVARFSGRLKVEAERMGRLIEDILALASAQDKSTDRFALVDVCEVVAEAVARQATHAGQVGIAVTVAAPGKPVDVMGDAAALVTAVDNLIDNALNYSPRGSTVAVKLGTDKQKRRASISVTDRGIGIDVADQGRVFERFYRSDRARSRRTGGTGLGLAIVKNVALGHGGTVSVRSAPGQGSTFVVQLPLIADASDEPEKV